MLLDFYLASHLIYVNLNGIMLLITIQFLLLVNNKAIDFYILILYLQADNDFLLVLGYCVFFLIVLDSLHR